MYMRHGKGRGKGGKMKLFNFSFEIRQVIGV